MLARLYYQHKLNKNKPHTSSFPITGDSSLSEFGAAPNLHRAALDHPLHQLATEMGLPVYVSLDDMTVVPGEDLSEKHYSMTGRVHVVRDKKVRHTVLAYTKSNF